MFVTKAQYVWKRTGRTAASAKKRWLMLESRAIFFQEWIVGKTQVIVEEFLGGLR